MTKLPKPIVLTIETHEQALAIYHGLNLTRSQYESVYHGSSRNWVVDIIQSNNYPIFRQLSEGLKAQSINPDAKPPQPLRVGGHEVKAGVDGSIRVGCTTVSRPTLEAIVKLSSEAMGGEWPKWFKSHRATGLLRFDNESGLGEWHYPEASGSVPSEVYTFQNISKYPHFVPITPLQAREILEGGR